MSRYQQEEHMYKHRLIFLIEEEAEQAEETLRKLFGDEWAEWDGVSDISDESPSFELTFCTSEKLDAFDRGLIMSRLAPATYSMNEDAV